MRHASNHPTTTRREFLGVFGASIAQPVQHVLPRAATMLAGISAPFAYFTNLPTALGITAGSILLPSKTHAQAQSGNIISAAYFSFHPNRPENAAQAPGSLISIFDVNLAQEMKTAESWPWSTELSDASVLVNGRKAPLHFVSPGQINAQVPYETELGKGEVTVVNSAGKRTLPITVAARSPWAFGYGTGFASALRRPANGAPATNPLVGFSPAGEPARPGDYVSIYFTGAGHGDIAVPSGTINPGDIRDFGKVSMLPTPTIRLLQKTPSGETSLDVIVLGAAKAPNYIGLDQVNIQIPYDTKSGVYTIDLRMDGIGAAAVDLPVQRENSAYVAGRVTTIGRDFSRPTKITLGNNEFSPSARGHFVTERTTTAAEKTGMRVDGEQLYGFIGTANIPPGPAIVMPDLFAIPRSKISNTKVRFDPNAPIDHKRDLVHSLFVPADAGEITMMDFLHYDAINTAEYAAMYQVTLPNGKETLWRWNDGPMRVWLDPEHAPTGLLPLARSALRRWHKNGTPWFYEVDYDPTARLDDNGVKVTYDPGYNVGGMTRRENGTFSGFVNLQTNAEQTCVHEFGHAGGLPHSPLEEDIMYLNVAVPIINGYVDPRTHEQEWMNCRQQLPLNYALRAHMEIIGRSASSQKVSPRYASHEQNKIILCQHP